MPKLTLFHGTNVAFDVPRLEASNDRRDFGRGFYTATLEAQAEQWARTMAERRRTGSPLVNVYELSLGPELDVLEFDGISPEWLEFVRTNRTQGGLPHSHDVVIGPVANDVTTFTIARYTQGIITAQEAMERLRYSRPNDQVSLHTPRALGRLTFLRRYEA